MRRVWVVFAVVMAVAAYCLAAPGDLIRNQDLPVPGVGVSVGVDCDGNVFYTLSNSTNLYKMDKDGNLLDTIDVGMEFDEISWDNGRKVFWAALHGSNPVDIYTIDPATGGTNFEFTSATVSLGTYRDGLAYDGTDDSLWSSGDVSDTIEHHAADGTLLGTITPRDVTGAPLGLISGVFAGNGGQLYLGRNGAVEIVRVTKSDGSFIDSFASPGGARDEGLECDVVNFAPLTVLWSREFDAPGFISIIELEPGSCSCGGAPEPTPTGSPVVTPTPTATVPPPPTATPTATATPPPSIPAVGDRGLIVFVGLLALAGAAILFWRRM